MAFGPPPFDTQKVIDQLVSQGLPLDQATQIANSMANDVNGVSQSPENKIINTAAPIAGAVVGGAAAAGAAAGGNAAGGGASGSGSSGGSSGAGGGASGSGSSGGSSGTDWTGLLSSLGSDAVNFIKSYGGDVVAGLAAYEAYHRSQQADQYAQQAGTAANQSWNAKAPIRAMGISGLLGSGKGNPFASATGMPVANGPTGTNGTNQTGGNYSGPIPPAIQQGAIQNPNFANGQAPQPATGGPPNILNALAQNQASAGPFVPRNPAVPVAPSTQPTPGMGGGGYIAPMKIAGT